MFSRRFLAALFIVIAGAALTHAEDRVQSELKLVLGWLATKLARNIYKQRKQTTARVNLIWDRNHRIRHALEAISPLAHPSTNQQSIRIIREEVDQIEGALKDVFAIAEII